MTHIYQWFSFPQVFSVECAKCKGHAICSNAPITKATQVGASISYEAIGEPGIFEADISCLNCGFSGRKTIHWPRDAFWKCQVKGKILWAFSLEHANVLLEFIQSSNRNYHDHTGYLASLLHLPKHFKLAKNRKSAVISIKRLIGKSRGSV
jgi:hypothetical protein